MHRTTINGKVYTYRTVGQTNAKGYKRISRMSALFKAAASKLGDQADSAVWLHIAICTVANGKPPGPIGIGRGKWTCDHVDGDNANNSPSNLKWLEHNANTGKGNRTRQR